MEQRFALLPATRWVAPAAVVFGLLGAAVAQRPAARAALGGGALAIALAAYWERSHRPTLIIDDDGYRVEERRREKLRVPWSAVRHARAVAKEQAMYLDCGDPAKNLLLPTRHGFGFRFAKQPQLYLLLARQLGARVEIVETLLPTDGKK